MHGCYLHVAGAGSFPIWEGAGLALLIIYSLRCCLRATAITWPVVLFDFECYIYIFITRRFGEMVPRLRFLMDFHPIFPIGRPPMEL